MAGDEPGESEAGTGRFQDWMLAAGPMLGGHPGWVWCLAGLGYEGCAVSPVQLGF